MAGARAFCWPTLFEGYGMPVAEALAAGVPVVCSDDPSLDEAAGEAAWRAPARDAQAVAGAILQAVGDETERARRIALGRAHAASRTWEACGTVFVEAIEGLAAGRS
jgi:alpha-1,3-rhamnosyl/mannosyltransferase